MTTGAAFPPPSPGTSCGRTSLAAIGALISFTAAFATVARADDALKITAVVDGILTPVLVAAYVLSRGYAAW